MRSSEGRGTNRTKRNAGRPIGGDSVGHEAILLATISLLRDKTVEKLTLSDVATAANVDRALVRYYFRDKTGLLRAVTARVLNELQGKSQTMFTQHGTLEEKIRMRLELLIDVMHEMPQFAQLVFAEIYGMSSADHQESIDADGLAQDVVSRGLTLTRVLIESKEVDAVGRTLDARFLHIMVLGACVFFATSGPLLQRMFAGSTPNRSLTDDYISFLTKMLMRGLGAKLPPDK